MNNKGDENEELPSSSDDNSEEDSIDDASTSVAREKRDVEWCAVDTEQYYKPSSPQVARSSSPNITWPPNPSLAGTYNWSNLRPVKFGNPLYGTRMQLFSRTNYNLAVYADGSVRGTRDDNDLHTHLELISAGYPGHLRIQGILTKLYVAMDKKGRLYGEADVTEEGTVFIESFQGSYSSYLSRKYAHLGWYLGIKKSGRFKRGPKTTYRQKAVLFLPRRSKFE